MAMFRLWMWLTERYTRCDLLRDIQGVSCTEVGTVLWGSNGVEPLLPVEPGRGAVALGQGSDMLGGMYLKGFLERPRFLGGSEAVFSLFGPLRLLEGKGMCWRGYLGSDGYFECLENKKNRVSESWDLFWLFKGNCLICLPSFYRWITLVDCTVISWERVRGGVTLCMTCAIVAVFRRNNFHWSRSDVVRHRVGQFQQV